MRQKRRTVTVVAIYIISNILTNVAIAEGSVDKSVNEAFPCQQPSDCPEGYFCGMASDPEGGEENICVMCAAVCTYKDKAYDTYICRHLCKGFNMEGIRGQDTITSVSPSLPNETKPQKINLNPRLTDAKPPNSYNANMETDVTGPIVITIGILFIFVLAIITVCYVIASWERITQTIRCCLCTRGVPQDIENVHENQALVENNAYNIAPRAFNEQQRDRKSLNYAINDDGHNGPENLYQEIDKILNAGKTNICDYCTAGAASVQHDSSVSSEVVTEMTHRGGDYGDVPLGASLAPNFDVHAYARSAPNQSHNGAFRHGNRGVTDGLTVQALLDPGILENTRIYPAYTRNLKDA